MITKNEIIEAYDNAGFIIHEVKECYSIRAPDFMDTDETMIIHEKVMNGHVEKIGTIESFLILAIKTGLIKVE